MILTSSILAWIEASGSVLADVLCRERKEGEVSRALDGDGQPALVLGARSSLPAVSDLATICQEAAEGRDVLVVDDLGLFETECANFAASLIATTAVASPSGSTASRASTRTRGWAGCGRRPSGAFRGRLLRRSGCLFSHVPSVSPRVVMQATPSGTLARRERDGVTCYRVVKMEVQDEL